MTVVIKFLIFSGCCAEYMTQNEPPMQMPIRLILGTLMLFADEIDDVVHVTVDMIVNGQEAILARGVAPVHHIQVNAFLQKCFHNASDPAANPAWFHG
ncbi:MAG: hypothetical protein MZV70_27710 [Desulfobacterales bacterium]|nr:hypothetical protein [Desulfobacterales bacterium]